MSVGVDARRRTRLKISSDVMTGQTETLVTRGTRVRVRRAGSGKPVLFLHGAGGWPAWQPFFERLSQRFALTVPEHPSFGASDDPHRLLHSKLRRRAVAGAAAWRGATRYRPAKPGRRG